MSNSSHPEDSERNIFDPFPEPRTIPGGWHLPESDPDAETVQTDNAQTETVNLHPILLCLN